MFPLLIPMAIGMAIGAASNRQNPLKGAAIGAGMGALGGFAAPMLGAAGGAAAGGAGAGATGAAGGGLLGGGAAGAGSAGGGLLGTISTYGKPIMQGMSLASQSGLLGGGQEQPMQAPQLQQPTQQANTLPEIVAQMNQQMDQQKMADIERRKRRQGLLGGTYG